MELTKDFLKILQQRLKVGNLKGVHLNAIPGRSRYKFDIYRLSQIHQGMPDSFVETLLGNTSFKFKINFEQVDLNILSEAEQKKLNDVASGLNNLLYQTKDIELEHGINSFGFGYPLLVRRNEKDNSLVVAPLVIWSLKIERPKELNTWIIKKTEDDPIYFNEVLINHIESDSGVQLDKIRDESLGDDLIDRQELIAICLDTLGRLNNNLPAGLEESLAEKSAHLVEIPKKDFFENITAHDCFIHWGGLFSIFQTQKESIIKEFDDLLRFEGMEIGGSHNGQEGFQTLSSIETDPSQQGILNSLNNGRNIVIQGPPGTGKSQTLTAIIINALATGKKTIVVCEKRTALDVIQQNLKEKGLGNLTVLIKDVKMGRKEVVDNVRETIDAADYKRYSHQYSRKDLEAIIDKCDALIHEINQAHFAVGTKVLENRTWTDVVGLLVKQLRAGDEVDAELSIDSQQLALNFSEYNQLILKVENAEQLYRDYEPNKDLSFVNPVKFSHENPYRLEEQLHQDFKDYQVALDSIQGLKDKFIDEFKAKLLSEWGHFHELAKTKTGLIRSLQESNNPNPDFYDPQKTNSFLYRFLANFSDAKKRTIENQQAVLDNYAVLSNLVAQFRHIQFEFQLTPSIEKICEQVQSFDRHLMDWKNSWPNLIEKELEVLESGNSVVDYQGLSAHEKLVQEIKLLLERINNDGWGKDKLVDNGHYASDLKQINAVLAAKKAYFDQGDHSSFLTEYKWFSNFNLLGPVEKEIILNLLPRKEWVRTFSVFYLQRLLMHHATGSHPVKDEKIATLTNTLKEIPKQQLSYIRDYWRSQQLDKAFDFDQNNPLQVRNLYNKRSSKSFNRNSLREIVKMDFDLFTTFFPVVLITPDACSSIFRNQTEAFDIVLLDEASQLKVEETLPALMKGKQKIIAGDEHQMPPSNFFSKMFEGEVEEEDVLEEDEQKVLLQNVLLETESLLEFATSINFEQRYLDFHYRSRHPYLIDFSNQAFYKGRLCPSPNQFDYRPISFIEVNGTYSDNTNEAEAETVVNILDKNILRQPDDSYPTVGIATFNIKQRDLIIEKIRDRANRDKAFAEKAGELERNGLFVKNLENIQGDERDVIIISTTYGIDKNGNFQQRFGPINFKKGYKLLNVIITRAKYKVFVCTSIPTKIYSQYRDHLIAEGENNRRGVLYAYLSYSKAVSDGNEEARQNVLKALKDNTKSNINHVGEGLGYTESPFEEEVYELLRAYFDESELIPQYAFAGFRIDLVYRSKDETIPSIAIECDGAKYHSSKEAYLYDIHRQKILEHHGFLFYRIWSTNWWRDYQREAEKLVAFLKDNGRSLRATVKSQSLTFIAEEVEIGRTAVGPAQLNMQFSASPPPIAEADKTIKTGTNATLSPAQLTRPITQDCTVVLRHLDTGKKLKVKTTAKPSLANKVENGIQYISEDSPLAKSMLGHVVGDIIKAGAVEAYFEVMEVGV